MQSAKRKKTDEDNNNNNNHNKDNTIVIDEDESQQTAAELQQGLTASINSFKSLTDKIAAQIKLLEEKENKWQTIQKQMEEHSKMASKKVVLDVGGTRVATTKDTLMSQEGTFFHAMLSSGKWLPGEDGMYFIDRNANHIGIILDFLRMRPIDCSSYGEHELSQLKEDLDFYQISGFPLPILSKLPENSIVNIDLQQFTGFQEYTLLYRAKFHEITQTQLSLSCSQIASTFIVLKVGDVIIGGYNPLPWIFSYDLYTETVDPAAFLFVQRIKKKKVIYRFQVKPSHPVYARNGVVNFGPDLSFSFEGWNGHCPQISSVFPQNYLDPANKAKHLLDCVGGIIDVVEMYKVKP